MKRFAKAAKIFAAVIFWLTVWQIIALCINKPLLLPNPADAFLKMFSLIGTADFWYCTGMSLLRITAGIFGALVLGIMLSFAGAAVKAIEILISPLLNAVKSTPVASFIILLLIFIGRDILPSVICALIVLPVVYSNLFAGIKNIDKNLLEVGKIFKFPASKKLRHIYIPSVSPYFVSACRSSLGLAWKAGIAAEVLALPQVSIGKRLFESKLYLETEELFAWTLAVIFLSLIIEYAFIKLTEHLSAGRGVRGLKRNDNA